MIYLSRLRWLSKTSTAAQLVSFYVGLTESVHAAQEIAKSPSLQATTAASVVSIAFFNFFGVSVTKRLSGAARCTIDACRTLFIWRAPETCHVCI